MEFHSEEALMLERFQALLAEAESKGYSLQTDILYDDYASSVARVEVDLYRDGRYVDTIYTEEY